MNKVLIGVLAAIIALTLIVVTWQIDHISIFKLIQTGSVQSTNCGLVLPVTGSELKTWNVTKKHLRLICWILTGPKYHMERAIHVKRTWGRRCDKLLFMSSKEDKRLGSVALKGVEEGHEKLWPKTQKAFQYIWQHHRHEADWILKADDDTYVFMDHLRDFLQRYNSSEAHYFGRIMKYGKIPPINYGGTGYVLSIEATRLLVEVALVQGGVCHRETRKGHKEDEDVELGRCLASVGVKPERTEDKRSRLRFIERNPFIFWKKMGEDYKKSWRNGPICCSDGPISFHHVKPAHMYMLEYFTNNMKGRHNSIR